MKIKGIIAALTAIPMFSGIIAYAGILGNEATGGFQTDMGGGAVYTRNVYTSSSVGRQTENYVEYTPNSESVPIVVNGASVWGKRTITSAAGYMEKNEMRPLIGINADFFSIKTGIPMGYTIIDGKLFSKEAGLQDAVGFRSDGTAFIDKIGVDSSLTHDNVKISVRYINKWLQDGQDWVNLLTDDFDSSTHTSFEALFAVCSPVTGDLSLNSTMTLTVDDVFIYNGDIAIPEGKYVFVMDVDGNKECYDLIANLAPGDTVTFASSVYGAERYDWTEAEYAVSSIGGRLINNGTIGSGFEAGTNPRTAVGVKDNGNVIFYTLDGRQAGHSYGAQLNTLARRMEELGCIDAINLDGGGSTAIGGVFPGFEDFTVSNKPSDGALRSCANYLFLRDLREQTGIPWYIEWYDIPNYNVLAGTSVQLKASKVYDTGNYKMDGLNGIEFGVENSGNSQSTVDESGLVTFKGTGDVHVSVTGERYNKSFDFAVFESPDEIRITDESNGGGVDALYLDEGGSTTVNLAAAAYVNGVELMSYPSLFRWEISGSIGTVDEDGNVMLSDDGSGGGSVKVTAGEKTVEIPIYIIETKTFSDTGGHWAESVIEKMADSGIINGFEENGKRLFRPDSNITRIQFAAIICKALGLNTEDYSDVELLFADNADIQPWAVDYVKAMVVCGYINGVSDDGGATTYFAPEKNITRAEAFTILSRTIDSNASQALSYTDSGDIPIWAQGAFGKLAAMGIINGFEDNTIRPSSPTTRAEAAALVSKCY